MAKLSVNINKIATLRNTRPLLNIPDLIRCATICLDAGADGITIHPRPDQRHIRSADVADIARVVAGRIGVEFNIEGNPFHGEYLRHCRATRPRQATLVPDEQSQLTSDHGWELAKDGERLRPVIAELKALGCRVSLFMDPLPDLMEAAAGVGADRIELYTEPYAAAFSRGHPHAAEPFVKAARRAKELNLGVNAGHDLNLQNLAPFLQLVPNVEEVSIGHALIADALELGLAETVRRYSLACAGDAA